MAQMNKIQSFKTFSELKMQEKQQQVQEEQEAKRSEVATKIADTLAEMEVASLEELTEEQRKQLVAKLFNEDAAQEIEDKIKDMGEPTPADEEAGDELEAEMAEGNAFIYAAAKAKAEGKEDFEFNGKSYKVTLKKDTGLKESFQLLITEATRWQFGIIDKGGKIQSNYVHYDGYPSVVLPEIKGMSAKEVKKMLKDSEMGGMSSLGDFYNDSKKSTIATGDVKKIKNYLKEVGDEAGAEYVYLYDERDGQWYGADVYTDGALKPVEQLSESVITEAKSFSESEIKATAEIVAAAVARVEGTKTKVINFETLDKNGKIAGFYIHKDNDTKGAPSRYWVTDSGEVVSAFRHDTFGDGVIANVGDKLASVVKTFKANESIVNEAKSFSESEIKATAEIVAAAVARVEGTKTKVINFETLDKNGKIAGFYIHKDNDTKGAPSRYWVTDSGEVVSAFRHDTFGDGVIANVGDKLASVVKTFKANESIVNEGARVMAKKLLQSLIDGETSRVEGIKMSKEMAEHLLNWINTSPFGKKNEKLPLEMLIKASFNWGIERGLPSNLKSELADLKSAVSESVNEAEVSSDAEFKEYAFTVLKKAFGSDFDEAKGQEVVDGILKSSDGDYGAAVGMLTSSLGESVTNEAIDVKYWEDYHEKSTKITSASKVTRAVEDEVEDWNDNNENGSENEVTSAGEKKVMNLARDFFKAAGWISSDIIQAMIAQES